MPGSRAFPSLGQTWAILWAQWRSMRNFLPRQNAGGLVLGAVVSIALYGVFTVLAIAAAVVLAGADSGALRRILPIGLLVVFLYWQTMPLLMTASGVSLDVRKLLTYPIPRGALFRLEVLLRVSAGFEVVLVLGGALVGLLLNPLARPWGPPALIAFAAFNLLLSVGIRDLLSRLLARKGIRELAAFLLVMVAVLPRLVAYRMESGAPLPSWAARAGAALGHFIWPWTATAALSDGAGRAMDAAALAVWIAIAWVFARRQFDRAIRIESSETASAPASRQTGRASWIESFYRFPRLFWRDPVAAVMEKELRSLTRSPRFRLLFLMGFSFGLIVWFPLTRKETGFIATHFLTVVSAYAVLLLGDVLFCNSLGFDRSAAQFYFVAPSGLKAALQGKNLAALFFLFLEISLAVAACLILRLRITPGQILESYAVGAVLSILLLVAGNYLSLLYPRPVNPASSLRNSSGRKQVQVGILITFPLAAIPIGLAYLAGYAFDTRVAFFAVLGADLLIGLMAYRIGLDSAVARGERNAEKLAAALSQGAGPVAG